MSRLGDAVDDDGEATAVASFDDNIESAPNTDADDDTLDDGEDTRIQTMEEVEAALGGPVAPESSATNGGLSDSAEEDTDSATVAVYDRPMATISFELPEYDEVSAERDTTTSSAPTKRPETTAVASLAETPQSDPLPAATMDSRSEFSRSRFPVFLAVGVGAGLVVGLVLAVSTGRLSRGPEVTPVAAPVEQRDEGRSASVSSEPAEAKGEPAEAKDEPVEAKDEPAEAKDESPAVAASAEADHSGRNDSSEDQPVRSKEPPAVPLASKSAVQAATRSPKPTKPPATELLPVANPYESSSTEPDEVSTPSQAEATQPKEAPTAVEPEPDEPEAKDELPDSLLPDDELRPSQPARDDPF